MPFHFSESHILYREESIFNIGNEKGGKQMSGGYGYGAGFALIVVLFILLIIVGAAALGGYGYGGY